MNNQIHIYSVDTNDFYYDDELEIHKQMSKMFIRRSNLKNMKHSQKYKNIHRLIDKVLTNLNRQLKEHKQKLKEKLLYNSNNNKLRKLHANAICDRNIISVFESTLTRSMGLQHNDLTDNLIVVQAFYFTVLEDIIVNGFTYNNEKYVVYTASAGQIRTKKTVFIKEIVYNKIKDKLMCGLSIDIINNKGGINTNKALAYLALNNSATDLWSDFDINKAIVVNDFKTDVLATVDFIDRDTYEIERKKMKVPIEHTDGAGMILPKISNKSKMIRLPWVKGLLVPFPYDKFIREYNKFSDIKYGIVKDIYGKEYDLIKDDIQIIFTKSQFKMWKYYKSWQEYKDNFIKHGCEVGMCNEEEDEFVDAKLNYQMLQTLTNMNDCELKSITKKTRDSILNITSDRDTMLKAFGAIDSNINKSNLQKALSIYPEMLKDAYIKDMIKKIRKSMIENAYAAKFEIEGKYTFICPDLYAFCENLILGIDNPKGLLCDGEVFCDLYKDKDKLDCLRSPHLYCDHAIRKNVGTIYTDRYKEIKRWFITDGLYTSCHDVISKILMFDVDGDKSLVCADDTIISCAERHIKDVVPLYYEMATANAHYLDNRQIYEGLKSAYIGGNIGVISNDITKIWNSEEVNTEAIYVVKILCMENNFTIDYAKTLYKLKRPKDKNKIITKYTNKKVPYFFKYAKGKEEHEVLPRNNSVVNRLKNIIPNPNIKFKSDQLGDFDYRMLLSNKRDNVDINLKIITEYKIFNSHVIPP